MYVRVFPLLVDGWGSFPPVFQPCCRIPNDEIPLIDACRLYCRDIDQPASGEIQDTTRLNDMGP